MEDAPFHQRPSFRILLLGLGLAGLYAYLVITHGGVLRNAAGIVFDAILLLVLVQLAVFFYAQFTLPVRTLRDRTRVSSRLWLHWRKAHGPAVFIQDGREIARAGESERRGPGLIWIDSASAAVTWSALGRKDVLGPGIHFTDATQAIGRTFSLHTQTCSLGPEIHDPVFDKPGERASEEQLKQHAAIQASRSMVSWRTRDGNEVVPRITVVFRLDSEPVRGKGPGSRFGFSAEAVERASRAEGINADLDNGQQSRVAWNQMPGLIAIELWREYLARFTLDELFSPTFPPLPDVPQPAEPLLPIDVPSTPLITKRNLFVRLLRQRNNAFEQWLDRKGIGRPASLVETMKVDADQSDPMQPDRRCTALQIIGEMVQRRMTRAAVPILDECGRVLEGHTISPDDLRLKDRGLAIQNVAIGDLRFDPSVEKQIVQQWNTGWLAEAETERQQVEQMERLAGQTGRQKALVEHALLLARGLQQVQAADTTSAVRALLRTTQNEIVADARLYAQARDEAEAVSDLIRWVESDQHD